MVDVIDSNKGYLDEKFEELRRASLADAAATIYVAMRAVVPQVAPDQVNAQREELLAQAAKDAVALYFRV